MSDIDIFKMNVRQYNTIEDEIKSITLELKPYNEKLKNLKSSKKELETQICLYMQNNEINKCKLEDSSLIHKEQKTIVPLKKVDIKDSIAKFFNNNFNDKFIKLSSAEKADTLFNFIYKDSREFVEKSSLNRIN